MINSSTFIGSIKFSNVKINWRWSPYEIVTRLGESRGLVNVSQKKCSAVFKIHL